MKHTRYEGVNINVDIKFYRFVDSKIITDFFFHLEFVIHGSKTTKLRFSESALWYITLLENLCPQSKHLMFVLLYEKHFFFQTVKNMTILSFKYPRIHFKMEIVYLS